MHRKMKALLGLIKQVADFYGLEFTTEGNGEWQLSVNIGEGILQLYIQMDDENPDQIQDVLSLSVFEGQDPIELDHLHELDYDEFLDMVSDLNIEPPDHDFGIAFQNIISWLIAGEQKSVGRDLESLFEAGWYKIRATVPIDDGEARVGYWLEATSSDDAKTQFLERAPKATDLKIEGFTKTPPDYGPDDIADELE